MARLSNDELRSLIADTAPDIVVDESTTRAVAPPPPDVKPMPDRAALAAKVARARGLDAPAEAPAPLQADQSQFFDQKVETADGTTRKAAVISCATGQIIAQQG
jgi:predicted component of type VI protein secretion system